MHDKALLEGICKHGIGRHDLMVTDTELPFHQIVQNNIENSDINDANLESTASMLIRIAWPKELVIARRIEALCELILRPKPQKRQIRSRKRKSPGESAVARGGTAAMTTQPSHYAGKKPVTGGKTITPAMAAAIAPPPHVANRKYLSDIASSSDDDDGEDEEDQEIIRQKRARYELYQQQQQQLQQQHYQQMRVPTKPLKSQGFRYPPAKSQQSSSSSFYHNNHTASSTPATVPSERSTPSTSNPDDEEMEEGEISYSDDDGDDEDDNSIVNGSSSFAF